MRLGIYTDTLYGTDGESLGNSRAFTRFLTSLPPRVDEVVLFGRLAPEPGRAEYPLPTALLFAAIARRRGVPLVLGVRQDYPRYVGGRLPGRAWAWAVPAARV